MHYCGLRYHCTQWLDAQSDTGVMHSGKEWEKFLIKVIFSHEKGCTHVYKPAYRETDIDGKIWKKIV